MISEPKNCAHCGIDIDGEDPAFVRWCSDCATENVALINALNLTYPTGNKLVFSGSEWDLTLGMPENVAKLRAIPRKEDMPKGDFKPGDKVLYGSERLPTPATIVAPYSSGGWIIRFDKPDGSCVSLHDHAEYSRYILIANMLGFDHEEVAFHFASTSILKHNSSESKPTKSELVAPEECQDKSVKTSTSLTLVGVALGLFGAAYEANKRLEAKAVQARVVKDEHQTTEYEEEQCYERTS
jgi:hypothetical protein